MTDPDLLDTARKQLAGVLASGDPLAFIGWWEAWAAEPAVEREDLAGLVKAAWRQ